METKAPGDQRILLHNVSWDTYERLLEERGESRVPRFAYDRGERSFAAAHKRRTYSFRSGEHVPRKHGLAPQGTGVGAGARRAV